MSGRTYPAGVVRLARELPASGRLPFLAGEVYPPMLCGVLSRLDGWTVADVVAAVAARLRACGQPMYEHADRPVSYLGWLLRGVDPARPPAQEAQRQAAELRAQRERQEAQRRAVWDRRDAAAVPAVASAGGRQARALLADLAQRRQADRLAAARLRERAAELRRPAEPAPVDRACAGGCDSYGPHVEPHTLPGTSTALAYCPACWDTVRRIR